MNKLKSISALLLASVVMTNASALAARSPELEAVVNLFQAAEKNHDLLDKAYDKAEQYVEKNPQDPVGLAYKGSLAAQKARDSILPWRKLNYLHEGVELMDVSVDKVLQAKARYGAEVELEVRMVRASTSARIPKLFGRGSVARSDFLRIVENEKFAAMAPVMRASAYAWLAVFAKDGKDEVAAEQWRQKAYANDQAKTQQILGAK